MDATIEIPNEARAAIECNALLDALRHGDYPAAARAQARLRELGWDLLRTAGKPARRNTRCQPEPVSLGEVAP
jgi:hypothetical protein